MSTEKKEIKFLNNKPELDQFYRNSRQNIEDPIFTGFTLSIDTLHSPLFYALAGDEYVVSETLRSAGGKDTSLAYKIEEKLSDLYKYSIMGSPDSYEINTIAAKDKFFSNGNDRRPGYGLWEKYDMDNVLYGAADYIYMVDKVADPMYKDTYGSGNEDDYVVDLGDGTPNNSSIYDQYSDQIAADPELQSLQGQVDNETSANMTINVFFNNNNEEHDYGIYVSPNEKPKIDSLISFMQDNPECTVHIDGYASVDGRAQDETYDGNLGLSATRCTTVMTELTTHGIDRSRITTAFHGDTIQPFAVNEQNRVAICTVSGKFKAQAALDLKIEKAESEISDTDRTAHDDNLKALYGTREDGTPGTKDNPGTGESAYNNYMNKIKEGSEYDDAVKKLAELNIAIDGQLIKVKTELTKYKEDMEKYLALLKSNSESEEAKKNIADIYDKFEKFIKFFSKDKVDSLTTDEDGKELNYSEKYKYITLDISGVLKDNTDVFKRELDDLKKYEEKNKEYFQKAFAVAKTNINGVKINEVAEKERQALMDAKEKLSKEIFGVHPDGRLGSETNPAPGSLCAQYQEAKEKANNDDYSQKQYRVDELRNLADNYDDVMEYQKYKDSKGVVTNNLPTINYEKGANESDKDYANRLENERNSRKVTYEVPQTVYDMMGFIRGMYNLTHYYPYVLQSISGLDEAYRKYFDLKDPYQGSGDDKITIDCLEFIDLRVSAMFNKYLNAVYDRQFRRERVPMNLRRFKCSIFVHDIRNFTNSLNSDVILAGNDVKKITEIALNSLSAIEFKFFDCEIVPEETGGIFDSVTNLPNNDMRTTKFTFKYGNCVINFLPFEDLKKYVLGVREDKDIVHKPDPTQRYDESNFREDYLKLNDSAIINGKKVNLANENKLYDGRYTSDRSRGEDLAGNFRRWYDKSELGNVNNNDYRDYIRHDSYVAVDDHYKTTIVNDFALNSVGQKNKELTAMDDALRKIVIGISASTGIPVKGVTDALNIKFIDPIINEKDMEGLALKEIGNVNNSRIVNEKTMEYLGEVVTDKEKQKNVVTDLGNVEKDKQDKE